MSNHNIQVLKETAQGKKFSRIPIWFMRQAGRYLPEYMAVKKEVEQNGGGFFSMCYDPKIASTITLQPLQRYDLDAAIIFSDILVILDSLDWPVEFVKDHGPQLQILHESKQLTNLKLNHDKIEKIAQTVAFTRASLPTKHSLIGFAGSPFTVALYALSGGKISNDLSLKAKIIDNSAFTTLCELLIDHTYYYLKRQIESGADVVKLFESHASMATFDEQLFQKYIITPNQKIITRLKKEYPEIPVIFFPRGAGLHYLNLMSNIPYDVLAIDETIPLSLANKFLQQENGKVLQGNLDNYLLCYGNKQQIQEATRSIVNQLGGHPFIFNLGHGIIKETTPEHVNWVIESVRELEINQ